MIITTDFDGFIDTLIDETGRTWDSLFVELESIGWFPLPGRSITIDLAKLPANLSRNIRVALQAYLADTGTTAIVVNGESRESGQAAKDCLALTGNGAFQYTGRFEDVSECQIYYGVNR